MVINDKHNFIFVHVYRTGGTSMDDAFPGKKIREKTHMSLESVPNWEKYFSFGFVRNPWDRTVSSYMFAHTKGKFKGTFEQYVHQMKGNTAKTHAQYNKVKNCSFVGRFEYMHEDIKQICEHIGMPIVRLPHIWKTKHKPYHEYYTDELKEIVSGHQQGDIENFGFVFDSPATEHVGFLK